MFAVLMKKDGTTPTVEAVSAFFRSAASATRPNMTFLMRGRMKEPARHGPAYRALAEIEGSDFGLSEHQVVCPATGSI